MNKIINVKSSFLLLCAVVLSGCAIAPYDYSALNEHKPRSILVIPPNNNSVEVNAPYIFLSTVSKPLAEKGYYVFPVSVIDHFLKQNGLPTPAEMNAIPLDKIQETIGADAVLYTTIEEWGQKFQLLSSKTIVNAKMRLVDVRSGIDLWDGHAYFEQSSGDGGGGLIGALANAVVTQIVNSKIDQTPRVSAQAVASIVSNRHKGLLAGPYAPQPKAK